MEQDSGNRFWWLPWILPIALVAVVVCAVMLPLWIFVAAVAVALVIGVPLGLRLVGGRAPEIQLPGWLPGGRPGDR